MKIDESICKDLGFDTMRQWLSKRSSSEVNKKNFLHLLPISNQTLINQSNLLTQELLNSLNRDEILPLHKLPNTKSFLLKMGVKGIQLDEYDSKILLDLLIQSRNLKKVLSNNNYEHWSEMTSELINFPDGEKKILSVYDDEFKVKSDASKKLKEINFLINQKSSKIESRLNSIFKHAKSSGWLQEEHIALRNGRSVLPMKNSQKRKIKGIVQSQSATGQTIFIEPLEMIELNNQIVSLKFELKEEIIRILIDLANFFQPYLEEISQTINFLIKLDFHYTIALFAKFTNSIAPNFSEKNNLILKKARNPILELAKKNVVPLNINLTHKDTILLLSGPNAGGKTVVLKTIGLISLMSQSGLFIPAEKCIIPIFDQVLCDIGDKQSIEDDLSTFSAHINYLKSIINNANDKTLILLDELGTGTDPEAGVAISRAVMEHILNKKSRMLATTHLGVLKSWAHEAEGVINGGMVFNSKELFPTYELQLGYPGASYAIEVATRVGLSKQIINRAKLLIGKKSVAIEDVLKVLEEDKEFINNKKNDLIQKQKELYDKEDKIKELQKEIKIIYKTAKSNAAEEAEILINETRRDMENLVSDIRSNNASKVSISKAKQRLKKSTVKLKKHKVKSPTKNKFTSISPADAIKGTAVYIPHLQMQATIINPPNNQQKITVESNGLKLTLKYDLVTLDRFEKANLNLESMASHKINRPKSISIDLRGKRLEPALLELEQFLDSALIAGMNNINILHGKGSGILMKGVSKFLKNQTYIKSYKFANDDLGGSGVTEVEFK